MAEMRERVGNDPLPVARVPSSRPLAARLWPAGLRREFVEGLLEGTVGGFLCKSSCEMVVPIRRRVVGRVRGGVLGGAVGGWRVSLVEERFARKDSSRPEGKRGA